MREMEANPEGFEIDKTAIEHIRIVRNALANTIAKNYEL